MCILKGWWGGGGGGGREGDESSSSSPYMYMYLLSMSCPHAIYLTLSLLTTVKYAHVCILCAVN